jgi:TPP-dependent pyruvate/acetoin dehydrogenase alpha subunit
VRGYEADADAWVLDVRERHLASPKPAPEEMFDHVYAAPPATLALEKDEALDA